MAEKDILAGNVLASDRLANIEEAIVSVKESVDTLTAAIVYTWAVNVARTQQGISTDAHEIMAGAMNGVFALYSTMEGIRRELNKKEQ